MSVSITWLMENIGFPDSEISNIAFQFFIFASWKKKIVDSEISNIANRNMEMFLICFVIVYEVNRLNNNNCFY